MRLEFRKRSAAEFVSRIIPEAKPGACRAQRSGINDTSFRKRNAAEREKEGAKKMKKIKVHIQRAAGNEDIPLPRYMTGQSAGMDIAAAVRADEIILPGQRKKIPTGIAIALPEGYEAQIRPAVGWLSTTALLF